jgi:hypothetical protein
MVLRKILLVAGVAALMSTPAWATPDQGKGRGASTVPAGPPSTTPSNTDNPGAAHRHSGEKGPGHHGKSHKCMPHKVGYVASGTLVSQALTKNEDGTYSGELTVQVTHTNHHASTDMSKAVPYTVSKVRLVLALEDTNKDGSVGVDDLAPGDRVRLVGKITALAKRCSQTGFKAETTIRQIVVHAPAPTTPEEVKS